MDSLIRETNENLKAIIDTMKSNLDNSASTLENIQIQMDKKVEEAKKYKIQVDDAKEVIKKYEEENKNLEISLKELNDKYGKMNLVSVIEAGNKEIKSKINNNNREINKQKEHIADLTNRARTIKDLLINLKKDRTIKESRLENIKIVYEYYNDRLNDIMDYAFNHAENLNEYKDKYTYVDDNLDKIEEVNNIDLDNTMLFDEIANIDGNKNFKDEMSFINDQIDETLNDSKKIDELIKKSLEKNKIDETNIIEDIEEKVVNDEKLDTTQVFDTIFENETTEEIEETEKNIDETNKEDNNIINNDLFKTDAIEETITNESDDNIYDVSNLFINEDIEETKPEIEPSFDLNNSYEEPTKEKLDIVLNSENEKKEENNILLDSEIKEEIPLEINIEEREDNTNNLNILDLTNTNENIEIIEEEKDSEDRINKINELFSINDANTETLNISNIETQIDNAYKDVFGETLEEEDLNKKEPTLTDIFGNPIKNEEISEEIKIGKAIEELFVENGIDFNKFKEDEQNYLKTIYDEEKFKDILEVLKRHKINLDNLYNSFNVFGEINSNELENIISILVNSGQSIEAIGLVLEKLPKVKKYNLNEAINSFGEYIKDIDITELIMKAKELYDGGNN